MALNIEYKTETAKDGNLTLVVLQDGKDIPFHSRINPLRESESASYEPDPEKYDLLLVLGCGLGYSCIKLKDRAGKYRHVIIIEILPGIEKIIAGNPATSFLARGGNTTILSGLDLHEIERAVAGLIDFQELRGVQVIEHPQSFRIFPSYYNEVKSLVGKIIDKKAGDIATIKAFGSLFLRNALNNLLNFNNFLPVSDLKGRFRGRSALIVSSAPSIEDNVRQLKNYESRLYIIAVDSVLPVLKSYGVRPDFVISIDPQGRIGEHFLGHDRDEGIHIFSMVSPPELAGRYGGYLSLNSHPVSQVFDDIYPGLCGSIDSATGSVAGDAFLFARFAGFDRIAMAGFDFSFSENIIYARGTAYQNRYALYFNSRFRTAETFNAGYIFRSSRSLVSGGKYTRRAFLGYRSSLDSLIGKSGGVKAFMINRRGLPLKNVPRIDLDSFIELSPGIKEKKSEFLDGLRRGGNHHPFNLKKVKERLLDRRIFDELIRESLGDKISKEKEEKIFSLIERIE